MLLFALAFLVYAVLIRGATQSPARAPLNQVGLPTSLVIVEHKWLAHEQGNKTCVCDPGPIRMTAFTRGEEKPVRVLSYRAQFHDYAHRFWIRTRRER